MNVWNYGHEENVAVPILVTGPDGKVTVTKWVVTGMVEPKTVKFEQIWERGGEGCLCGDKDSRLCHIHFLQLLP